MCYVKLCARHGTAMHGTARQGTEVHATAWHGMARQGRSCVSQGKAGQRTCCDALAAPLVGVVVAPFTDSFRDFVACKNGMCVLIERRSVIRTVKLSEDTHNQKPYSFISYSYYLKRDITNLFWL